MPCLENYENIHIYGLDFIGFNRLDDSLAIIWDRLQCQTASDDLKGTVVKLTEVSGFCHCKSAEQIGKVDVVF